MGSPRLLRHAVRELTRLREQMERQNALLARLADHFAPDEAAAAAERGSAAAAAGSTQSAESWGGVSFLDPIEASLVEDYARQTERDIGRPPTEDEVLVWLADEKTLDLHRRLKERAALAQLERRPAR